MRSIWVLVLFVGSLGLAEERMPDIVSVPADLDDYYVFKNGKWIWKEDVKPKPKAKRKKLRGIVTLGKTTIRYIPDETTPPKSKGN
jgi:hypothetical protein